METKDPINTAIDIGLRAILPDLIENQVIDIKNALLQNGLKSGIDTAVNSAINLGKSAVGIVTGNFENMDQVRMAVGNGGIVDTVSNVLDKAINNTYKKGYKIIEEITPENEHINPDICIINTCTVTNMSDRKSRQMLRRMKEKNQNTIVVAVGCYAQVAKEELAKIPEIDLVLGNNEKVEIVKYVEEYLNNHIDNIKLDDVMYSKKFSDFGDVTYTEKTRAVIKIQDGCDRFCSYCIIPYARGRVRSRKPESILSEITQIASK